MEGGNWMLYAAEAVKMNPSQNNLVTKSNMLIEANYKLGVVEQKIILCLASNIQPTDSDFKTYTLGIKEFTNLLGLKGTPKYTELRQITKDLMQKVFEVRMNKKVIQVAWLSYVAYNETEGTIDIRFDPFLRPYLLQLKREFTSYKLENVVKLKSSYAIRIYELLKQYEKIQERTFRLNDLRKMLGAEDVYPAYGNFKQRVLVPAQKELKKKTDISFEIEEIKNGRKVEKVCFRITSSKKKTSEQLSFFEGNLGKMKQPNVFFEEVKKIALHMGIQLTDEILAHWEKYGTDKVLDLLEKVKDRQDIENPIGYITSVLKLTVNDEVAATSEDQTILTKLIASFRKSKESLPSWFIEEEAIKQLKEQFEIDDAAAEIKFEELKGTLYEALNIKEPGANKLDNAALERKKNELEELLKEYRK